MSNISEQRRFLNEFLIAECRPSSGLVYDIGKSQTWDYRPFFPSCNYKTVDRDLALRPDILHDMERRPLDPQAGFIFFNGVFEQCDDPWAIMRNIRASLLPGGTLLAGIANTKMPLYGERDRWRITRAGIDIYFKSYTIKHLYELPEYFYAIAEKNA